MNCYSEVVVQRCSVKKVFLEIPQNSHENNCASVSSQSIWFSRDIFQSFIIIVIIIIIIIIIIITFFLGKLQF